MRECESGSAVKAEHRVLGGDLLPVFYNLKRLGDASGGNQLEVFVEASDRNPSMASEFIKSASFAGRRSMTTLDLEVLGG